MSDYRKRVGRFGEDLASKYLEKNNYKIIERNVQTGHQEIDIVARNNKNLLVFIEVKTRTNKNGEAEESVFNKKLKKLKIAIMKYMAKHKYSPYFFRLDLISIQIDSVKKIASIKHYKDII